MRGVLVAAACALLACGASQSAGERSVDGCSGGTEAAQTACVARGCSYGPESWCAGVGPPQEWQDRQARGELDCACTCQADIERCSMLP